MLAFQKLPAIDWISIYSTGIDALALTSNIMPANVWSSWSLVSTVTLVWTNSFAARCRCKEVPCIVAESLAQPVLPPAIQPHWIKFGRVTETQQGNTDRGTTGT